MSSISRREVVEAAAATVASCLLPQASLAQTRRRSLVVALPNRPGRLDPVLGNDTPSLRILSNVFDSLLRFDYAHDSALKPALASSWVRQDGRTVDFELRPNVVFHDGSVMTTDDVLFSFDQRRTSGPNGDGQTVAAQYQRTVEAVEKLGPSTIRIRTKSPDPAIEKKIAAWSCQIVSRKAFERAGSWENWLKAPIGAGPYRIADHQRDTSVTLVAHDAYWGGRPPFERIVFRIAPEAASRQNGLLAGDYDLVSDILPDQFSAIASARNLVVVGGPAVNVRVLVVDTTAPWLSDRRFRRALSLAIDRRLIVETLWAGRVDIPANMQYRDFGALYDTTAKAPGFDPAEARRLVKELGYSGEAITYRLMNNWYPNQVATAQILIDMWRDVGINVRIKSVENFSQAQQKPINAIWDSSILLSWPDPTALAWRLMGPGGGWNKLGVWKSNDYEAAGRVLEQSVDLEERKRANKRMLDIFEAETPLIILHDNGAFYGKKADLDWTPYRSPIMDFGPFNQTRS